MNSRMVTPLTTCLVTGRQDDPNLPLFSDKVYTPPKDCVPPARHLPAMLRNARPPAMQSEADGRGRRVAAPQALSGGSA